MINNEADEVIRELSDSLKTRYQNKLESVKGNQFVFDYVHLSESWWMKNKKPAINLINKKDNKYFQYAVTVVLNHKEIKKDPQRILKIKQFLNKYN